MARGEREEAAVDISALEGVVGVGAVLRCSVVVPSDSAPHPRHKGADGLIQTQCLGGLSDHRHGVLTLRLRIKLNYMRLN